jgi:hypothetical protein
MVLKRGQRENQKWGHGCLLALKTGQYQTALERHSKRGQFKFQKGAINIDEPSKMGQYT